MRQQTLRTIMALLALLPAMAWAQTTFQSGDFTYVVLDEEAKTAALSRVPEEFRGAVVVPETVINGGKTYTVTQIGSPASTADFSQSPFYYSTIESLTIPATVTKVTGSMFYYTNIDQAIQHVTIADSPNPITFDAIGYTERIGKLYIGRDVVYDNSVREDPGLAVFVNVDNVVIGPKVTTLRDNMLSNTGLDSVDFSQATNLTTIGNNVFTNNASEALTSIDLSKTKVANIGNGAFANCYYLANVTLPNTLTTIGDEAFYYCQRLANINIPSSVSTIGNRVFFFTDNIKNLTIEDGTTTLACGDIGEGLSGENLYIGRNVTYTSGSALVFTNVKNVTIGPKVTTIPAGSFQSRTSIESFDLSQATGLTSIGENAFYCCANEALTSIDLSKTKVTSIGNGAFALCYNLATVILPNTLTTIGNEAFYYCQRLANISIPASVTTIGDAVFWYADGAIQNLRFEDGTTPLTLGNIGDGIGCQNFYLGRDVTYTSDAGRIIYSNVKNVTVGPTVTTILDNMFRERLNVESFDLSNATSLTSIGDYAFYYINNEKFTDIIIPSSVKSIGSYAFASSSYLTTLDLSNATSLTTLGTYAFDACTRLAAVDLSATKVTAIPKRCFNACSGLTTLVIPATIQTIESNAFWNMDGDLNLTIEDSDTPLTLNNAGSFYPIFEYKNVTAYIGRNILRTGSYEGMSVLNTSGSYEHHLTFGPKVTTIGEMEYYDCDALRTVDMSNSSVTSIGIKAFRSCNNLESIDLGDKLETLGGQAFSYTGLKSIDFPASLKKLPGNYDGDGLFEDCHQLTTVTLHEGLEEIGSNVFYDCDALEAITIPASVKKIGRAPFYCNNTSAMKRMIILDSDTPLEFDNGTSEVSYGRGNLTDDTTLDYFYLGRDVTRETTDYSLAYEAKEIEIGPKVTDLGILFWKTGDTSDAEQQVQNVKVHWTTPIALAENAFHTRTFDNATLWVPGGTMTAYQDVNNNWKKFTKMEFSSYVVSVATTGHGTLSVADIEAGNGETKTTLIDRETDAVFSVTPDTGYELTAFTVNGEAQTPAEGKFTVANLLADQTVTATFAPITYNISYELAGGAVATANPATYTIESNAIKLNNPTREGYTFAGWTGTGLSKATKNVTIAKGSTGDRSYTATWTPIVYNITYELDGGSVATANPATYTIESEAITLNNPTKTGYTFQGWTGTGLSKATKSVTIAQGSIGARAYTATWKINQYTITFNSNGGSAVTAIKQNYGTTVTAPTAPTRTGYTFAGWTPALPATIPAENITVTAQWTINQYTITFDSDGGSAVDPITQDYNSAVTAPTAPTREGYTFAGWTPALPATMPAENKTVKATWTPVTYTISYTLDGGTVATANPTSYTIESADITLNNPTKDGYRFVGWTGTDLDAPTKTVTITTGSTGNRSYTATWMENAYLVSIIGEGVTADNMTPKLGQSVVITIEENEDRELTSLTVNGVDVTNEVVGGKYTITNVTADITVVATFKATKEFILMAHNQATFSCSQALDFSGVDGLKAYIASGYNKTTGTVLLTRVESVPAGTGLLLVGTEGVTYKVPYVESTDYYVNLLKPVLTPTVVPQTDGAYTNYFYSSVNGVEGFYKSSGSGTVAAQKAYLQLPTAAVAGVKGVSYEFDDTLATPVSAVKADAVAPEGVYDIHGRKIPAGQKLRTGVYVINGKKVVIK